MEITKSHVELFMTVLFLIKNHGYKLVHVAQRDDEFWLCNPSNIEFPVIHVTTSNSVSTLSNENQVLFTHHTILKDIKKQARLLEIHLCDDTDVFTHVDIEQVVIKDKEIYGKNISHYFPLIKNAIRPFDDPKAEMANLTRELEEYQSSKRTQKAKIKAVNRKTWSYSLILIAICVVFFLLINVLASNFDSAISPAIALGAYFKPMLVINHQYWRFLTVGLIHIDATHLLMNMYSLYILGPRIELVYGKKNFLILMLVSIISGSVAVFLFEGTELLVGISGGLYGLMAAFFVFMVSKGMHNDPNYRKSILLIVGINLLISLSPGVSLMGHLGGFVGGLVVALLVTEHRPWQNMKKSILGASLILALFCGYQVVKVDEVENIYYANYMQVFEIYDNVGLNWLTNAMQEDINDYMITGGN